MCTIWALCISNLPESSRAHHDRTGHSVLQGGNVLQRKCPRWQNKQGPSLVRSFLMSQRSGGSVELEPCHRCPCLYVWQVGERIKGGQRMQKRIKAACIECLRCARHWFLWINSLDLHQKSMSLSAWVFSIWIPKWESHQWCYIKPVLSTGLVLPGIRPNSLHDLLSLICFSNLCHLWGFLRSSLFFSFLMFIYLFLAKQHPDQGSNSGSTTLGVRSLSHWTTKEVTFFMLNTVASVSSCSWKLHPP